MSNHHSPQQTKQQYSHIQSQIDQNQELLNRVQSMRQSHATSSAMMHPQIDQENFTCHRSTTSSQQREYERQLRQRHCFRPLKDSEVVIRQSIDTRQMDEMHFSDLKVGRQHTPFTYLESPCRDLTNMTLDQQSAPLNLISHTTQHPHGSPAMKTTHELTHSRSPYRESPQINQTIVSHSASPNGSRMPQQTMVVHSPSQPMLLGNSITQHGIHSVERSPGQLQSYVAEAHAQQSSCIKAFDDRVIESTHRIMQMQPVGVSQSQVIAPRAFEMVMLTDQTTVDQRQSQHVQTMIERSRSNSPQQRAHFQNDNAMSLQNIALPKDDTLMSSPYLLQSCQKENSPVAKQHPQPEIASIIQQRMREIIERQAEIESLQRMMNQGIKVPPQHIVAPPHQEMRPLPTEMPLKQHQQEMSFKRGSLPNTPLVEQETFAHIGGSDSPVHVKHGHVSPIIHSKHQSVVEHHQPVVEHNHHHHQAPTFNENYTATPTPGHYRCGCPVSPENSMQAKIQGGIYNTQDCSLQKQSPHYSDCPSKRSPTIMTSGHKHREGLQPYEAHSRNVVLGGSPLHKRSTSSPVLKLSAGHRSPSPHQQPHCTTQYIRDASPLHQIDLTCDQQPLTIPKSPSYYQAHPVFEQECQREKLMNHSPVPYQPVFYQHFIPQQPVAEHRHHAPQQPAVEHRHHLPQQPVTEHRPVVEHRHHAPQQPVVECRPVVEHRHHAPQQPVVECRPVVEHRYHVPKQPVMECRPVAEHRQHVPLPPVVEHRHHHHHVTPVPAPVICKTPVHCAEPPKELQEPRIGTRFAEPLRSRSPMARGPPAPQTNLFKQPTIENTTPIEITPQTETQQNITPIKQPAKPISTELKETPIVENLPKSPEFNQPQVISKQEISASPIEQDFVEMMVKGDVDKLVPVVQAQMFSSQAEASPAKAQAKVPVTAPSIQAQAKVPVSAPSIQGQAMVPATAPSFKAQSMVSSTAPIQVPSMNLSHQQSPSIEETKIEVPTPAQPLVIQQKKIESPPPARPVGIQQKKITSPAPAKPQAYQKRIETPSPPKPVTRKEQKSASPVKKHQCACVCECGKTLVKKDQVVQQLQRPCSQAEIQKNSSVNQMGQKMDDRFSDFNSQMMSSLQSQHRLPPGVHVSDQKLPIAPVVIREEAVEKIPKKSGVSFQDQIFVSEKPKAQDRPKQEQMVSIEEEKHQFAPKPMEYPRQISQQRLASIEDQPRYMDPIHNFKADRASVMNQQQAMPELDLAQVENWTEEGDDVEIRSINIQSSGQVSAQTDPIVAEPRQVCNCVCGNNLGQTAQATAPATQVVQKAVASKFVKKPASVTQYNLQNARIQTDAQVRNATPVKMTKKTPSKVTRPKTPQRSTTSQVRKSSQGPTSTLQQMGTNFKSRVSLVSRQTPTGQQQRSTTPTRSRATKTDQKSVTRTGSQATFQTVGQDEIQRKSLNAKQNIERAGAYDNSQYQSSKPIQSQVAKQSQQEFQDQQIALQRQAAQQRQNIAASISGKGYSTEIKPSQNLHLVAAKNLKSIKPTSQERQQETILAAQDLQAADEVDWAQQSEKQHQEFMQYLQAKEAEETEARLKAANKKAALQASSSAAVLPSAANSAKVMKTGTSSMNQKSSAVIVPQKPITQKSAQQQLKQQKISPMKGTNADLLIQDERLMSSISQDQIMIQQQQQVLRGIDQNRVPSQHSSNHFQTAAQGASHTMEDLQESFEQESHRGVKYSQARKSRDHRAHDVQEMPTFMKQQSFASQNVSMAKRGGSEIHNMSAQQSMNNDVRRSQTSIRQANDQSSHLSASSYLQKNERIYAILQLVQNQLVEFLRQSYTLHELTRAFQQLEVKNVVQKHFRDENIIMVHRHTQEPLFRRELQLIGQLGDGAVFTESQANLEEEKVNPNITKILIDNIAAEEVKKAIANYNKNR